MTWPCPVATTARPGGMFVGVGDIVFYFDDTAEGEKGAREFHLYLVQTLACLGEPIVAAEDPIDDMAFPMNNAMQAQIATMIDEFCRHLGFREPTDFTWRSLWWVFARFIIWYGILLDTRRLPADITYHDIIAPLEHNDPVLYRMFMCVDSPRPPSTHTTAITALMLEYGIYEPQFLLQAPYIVPLDDDRSVARLVFSSQSECVCELLNPASGWSRDEIDILDDSVAAFSLTHGMFKTTVRRDGHFIVVYTDVIGTQV